MTNLAAHSLNINFFILCEHDYFIFKESGHLPAPLDDEEFPVENSPFNEYIHALGSYNPKLIKKREIPFKCASSMEMSPNQTQNLEIIFDSSQAKFLTNRATLVAQLSAPLEEQGEEGLYHRPSGTYGPIFEVELTARDYQRASRIPV